MTKPTVVGNAYRWAHPAIEQMVCHRPSAALDFLRADSTTKHFVALAVRGWETHQDQSERMLQRLAGDIFSRPSPTVLAELWGTGLGKLSFLKRLPGRVLPRRQYDELVRTLLDPQLRQLLHECSKISPEELAIIAHFNEPILAAASLRKVSRIGVDLFDYVLAVLRRHRPISTISAWLPFSASSDALKAYQPGCAGSFGMPACHCPHGMAPRRLGRCAQ
jgi:hypothetical protein